MYIKQYQLVNLNKLIAPQKAIIIYGPRRCGKTTLVREFLKHFDAPSLFVNAEDITVRDFLESESVEKIRSFVGNNTLLAIDEAQSIKNAGKAIKLIVDNIPGIMVIATGSASFDLSQKVGEPLTGRKYSLRLFPLSQLELNSIETRQQSAARLEERLIFGSYPEVVLMGDNAARTTYLKEIVSSYLCKDILELDGVRNSDKLIRLLQLLVFQIGKEVSHTELGLQLGMSKNTVERYLDLLEKAFVIFRLRGLSRNMRKEISKNCRYYFYDLGVRNALINNFNPISMRDDIGMLWENYIMVERIKSREYLGVNSNYYFWRTYDRKEVDLVEERDGSLYGYEITWNRARSIPKAWLSAYPNAKGAIINRENYIDFISMK